MRDMKKYKNDKLIIPFKIISLLYFSAVSCEHEDVVTLLLAQGADKSCIDCDGNSPLDLETTDSIRTLLTENR